MSCPTCDKTMQLAAEDKNGVRVHWCPCCGTLRLTTPKGHVNDEVPDLPKRCRAFEKEVHFAAVGDEAPAPAEKWVELWRQKGVAEAIYPPEERL